MRDTLRGYRRADLLADLGAGVTVGVVALPLAMAFAIASGLKPEAGLITAIVAGFLISALGGSNVQIGGPAGAFIVIVYGIVERYGVANLLIATSLAKRSRLYPARASISRGRKNDVAWGVRMAQRTRMPGWAPGQGLSTWMPGWAFSSAWLAASTMPSDTPNFILRGARLATITVSLPISSSGW